MYLIIIFTVGYSSKQLMNHILPESTDFSRMNYECRFLKTLLSENELPWIIDKQPTSQNLPEIYIK